MTTNGKSSGKGAEGEVMRKNESSVKVMGTKTGMMAKTIPGRAPGPLNKNKSGTRPNKHMSDSPESLFGRLSDEPFVVMILVGCASVAHFFIYIYIYI